jgi:preprotein translocase subunit YajC
LSYCFLSWVLLFKIVYLFVSYFLPKTKQQQKTMMLKRQVKSSLEIVTLPSGH